MFRCNFLWFYPVQSLPKFLNFYIYVLHQIWQVFGDSLFKHVFCSNLFILSFWGSTDIYFRLFDIVAQVFRVVSIFISIFFLVLKFWSGFLDFGTINILGQITFYCGRRLSSLIVRLPRNMPSFHPLGVTSTLPPKLWQPKVCPDLRNASFGEEESSFIGNHWVR